MDEQVATKLAKQSALMFGIVMSLQTQVLLLSDHLDLPQDSAASKNMDKAFQELMADMEQWRDSLRETAALLEAEQ